MTKPITSGIKSWKTTIIGIALAVLIIMQESADLANWQGWVFPALVAALGILSRDANKTSESSGVVPILLLFCILPLGLVSCGGSATAYGVDVRKYENQIKENPEKVIVDAEDVVPIGGFEFKAGAKVVTDYGEFNLSESGVEGTVVVDLSSQK